MTNAETRSASYIPNGKFYELQTWYTDGARRPVSATSVVRLKVIGPLVENDSSQKHHATPRHGNNAIIDSPCVSQFYLFKLVTGNHAENDGYENGMKSAVPVNDRIYH